MVSKSNGERGLVWHALLHCRDAQRALVGRDARPDAAGKPILVSTPAVPIGLRVAKSILGQEMYETMVVPL